jgi:hypothetical protein
VPPHHARAAADHEPGGGLFLDRNREHGAGRFERVADCTKTLSAVDNLT